MGKGTKQKATWAVLLQGSLLSLGVYLGGILLLALLLVKGMLPETGSFPVTAALCLLAALCGGLTTVRRTPWGTLPSALLNTAIFIFVLATAGLACWNGIVWTGRGGGLLLCALAGGVLAGLLGGRKVKRRKRK